MYKIKKFKNSAWVEIQKNNKFYALVMCKFEAARIIDELM